jgi:hypothetical protein
MAEFPDLLINPNPNAPTLDASGNQVRGINIFETTAERDALNITVRIPGALAVIKSSDELYQYTATTVDDTAWQDASNWLGIGSAGGAGVQNLNNLNGNVTLTEGTNITLDVITGSNEIEISAAGGGNVTVRAKLVTSVTSTARMRFESGYDATDGVMTVVGSNPGVKDEDDRAVGIALSGGAGDIVDLAVEGTFENFKYAVPVGSTPLLGQLLYSGQGGVSDQIGAAVGQGTFVVGRVISPGTFVQSFPGSFDVYEGTVFVKMPTLGAFFSDDTNYFQSTRTYARQEDSTVEQGEIVKTTLVGTISNFSRWDVSAGDTFVDIIGVTTTATESAAFASEVCVAGEVVLPTSLIGGAAATVGSVIYSDATNSYQLTTDATTGIKIGVVLEILPSGDLVIGVNPSAAAGGGATSFIELTDTQDDLLWDAVANPYGGFSNSGFSRIVGLTRLNSPSGDVEVAGTAFVIRATSAPAIGTVLTIYDDDFNASNGASYMAEFQSPPSGGLVAGTGSNSLKSQKTSTVALAPSDRQISIGFSVGDTSGSSSTNTISIGGYGTMSLTQTSEGDATVNHLNGVFIGPDTKIKNGGQFSTHVGYGAGKYSSGSYNTFIGREAGEGVSGGTSTSYSVAIGASAGNNLQTGADRFTAVGGLAGRVNNTGDDNTFLGYDAGGSVAAGSRNVYVGSNATGAAAKSDCVVVGAEAGSLGLEKGVAIGSNAADLATGFESIAIGYRAMYNNKGSRIIAIGYQAGQNAIVATNHANSIYIGYLAGDETEGSDNVALGYQACTDGDGGSINDGFNIAIGRRALQYSFGADHNVAIGQNAMGDNQGAAKVASYNVAIGDGALFNVQSSVETVAIGRDAGRLVQNADKNVFIGLNSGYNSVTGESNVGIGSLTFTGHGATLMGGDFNVAIGYDCGGAITTGFTNVFIGHEQRLVDAANTKSAAAMEGWTGGSASKFAVGVLPENYHPVMWGSMNMLTQASADAHVRSFNFQKVFNNQISQSVASGRLYTYSSFTSSFTQASAANAPGSGFPSLNALFYSTSSDADTGFVMSGTVQHTNLGTSGNPGDPVYLSTTTGNATLTKPFATGEAVRVIGYVIDGNNFHFNGSMDYTIV